MRGILGINAEVKNISSVHAGIAKRFGIWRDMVFPSMKIKDNDISMICFQGYINVATFETLMLHRWHIVYHDDL